MKIAVTGSKGKIGQRLVALGAEPLFCDITEYSSVRYCIENTKPDVIIHAAAISSVAKCEQDLEKAILVNTRGANVLFEVAEDVIGEGKVALLSSEQVFDGHTGYYKEADEPNPINDYGRTKHAAEGLASLYCNKVLRLSRCVWEFDEDIERVIKGVVANRVPDVPTFLYRSYCHLDFVAIAIFEYAKRFSDMPDLLHFGGNEVLSFYQFIRMIVGSDVLLKPRDHEEERFYPRRPLKCGFDISLWKSLGLPTFTAEVTAKRILHE